MQIAGGPLETSYSAGLQFVDDDAGSRCEAQGELEKARARRLQNKQKKR